MFSLQHVVVDILLGPSEVRSENYETFMWIQCELLPSNKTQKTFTFIKSFPVQLMHNLAAQKVGSIVDARESIAETSTLVNTKRDEKVTGEMSKIIFCHLKRMEWILFHLKLHFLWKDSTSLPHFHSSSTMLQLWIACRQQAPQHDGLISGIEREFTLFFSWGSGEPSGQIWRFFSH